MYVFGGLSCVMECSVVHSVLDSMVLCMEDYICGIKQCSWSLPQSSVDYSTTLSIHRFVYTKLYRSKKLCVYIYNLANALL